MITSRRTSLGDMTHSDGRQSIPRSRGFKADRVRNMRNRSHQKSISRSRSQSSTEEDSVSSINIDNAQLIQILQTFADTQLAAKTRNI